MTIKKDFELKRGDSKKITVNFTENAMLAFTGGSVFMTVKEKKTDTDAKAKIAKTVPITETDGTGQAVIAMTPADNELPPKTYYQDIQAVSSDKATVKTLVDGKYKITADITRTT